MISGPMRPFTDDAMAKVQSALQPAAFAEAFATGQQMTVEQGLAALLVTNVQLAP